MFLKRTVCPWNRKIRVHCLNFSVLSVKTTVIIGNGSQFYFTWVIAQLQQSPSKSEILAQQVGYVTV